MKNQGTVLATLVTTLLLGLVGIFTPTAAWAASVTVHPQTYVSTIQHRAKIVGPLETASLPIGSRPRAPGYDQNSTRSCCATGVGVTGGGPKFLRTLSGRRSHAYDLAANNTSASSSQPSPATASRGRESVGSSSVDREAPSVVVPFVAAEDEVATTPAGRVYSWHYLNETGPLRNIPGSVVDETIDQATDTTQLGDRTIYYDAKNDITVVQSDTTGKIMSVRRGAP